MSLLKKQSGIGLVEVLVGMAIVLVVIGGLMHAVHSSMVMQNKALAFQEAVGVVDEVRIILSSGTSCQANLGLNTFDLAQVQSKTGFKLKMKMFNGSTVADGEKQGVGLRVDQFRLRNGAAMGLDGAGNQKYFGRVSGAFSPVSGPFAGKSAERLIASVVFTVNPASKVINCSVTTANDVGEAMARSGGGGGGGSSCYASEYDEKFLSTISLNQRIIGQANMVLNGAPEKNGNVSSGSTRLGPSGTPKAVCVNGVWVSLYTPAISEGGGGVE